MWKAWVALVLVGGALPAEVQPVGMSPLEGTKLVVIGDNSILTVLDEQTGIVEQNKLQFPQRPVDLAAGGGLAENLIFVALRGSNTQLSPVVQCTPQGKEIRRWNTPYGYPSGIALDYPNKVLYITALQSGEIYRVDLNAKGGGSVQYLTEVPGASRLGALAVDTAGGRLLVAEPFSGTIYEFSLTTRKSAVLVRDLGQPSALAIGRGGKVLYIADETHKCIWAVRLDANPPKASQFWSSKDFRDPVALAVDSHETMWVGDRTAKAVFRRTSDGHEISPVR